MGPPPPTGNRDHLKIEKDGRLVNRASAPEPPSRPLNGSRQTHTHVSSSRVPLYTRRKKKSLCEIGFRIRTGIHLIRIRIQHFRLNTDPDPIRIQGFDGKNLKKFTAGKKFNFFGSKTTVNLSLGLQKGFPSYRRTVRPKKRTAST
jgi:hypothetical protein